MSSFAFNECHYTVQTTMDGKPKMLPCGQGKDKSLLNGITANVRAGHVLAIMGPSGAGKTTLLNMLTLEKKGGEPTGTLLLNGHPFTLELYKKHCAYVQQQDALWACLNARDHLTYAYSLFQPELSKAERDAEVDKTLSTLGLTDVQHVKAGNQFFRGLSGGLKRRLSIGIALAKNPLVLMLDEPTTGVDSASAQTIMNFLNKVAAERQIAVLCTIHQPPASVFADFDDTLILASGRIAYFGAAKELGAYLARLGKTPPEGVNMAEFALDLVNRDFASPEAVDAILDSWAQSEVSPAATASEEALPTAVKALPAPPRRAGFLSQCVILTKRAAQVALREPIQYTGRMVAIFMSVAFFGLLFLSSRELEQKEVQIRAFFLMFALGIPAQFMMVTVFAEFFTVTSIRREVKDGMYHPAAAAIASWLIQIPFMFVLSTCALVPAFAVGNLHWPAFGIALVIHATLFWSFEGMAQAQALEPSPLLGLMNFMNLFFMSFLFCGMFVDPADVIWPFRLFTYIMPLMWTMKAFIHATFIDAPGYEGVLPCTAGSMLAVPFNDPMTGANGTRGAFCLSHKNRAGYWCPNDPDGFQCFGESGADILDSLGARFTIFDSDINYFNCLLIVFAFGAFFRLTYIVRLVVQCSAAKVPKAADATTTVVADKSTANGAATPPEPATPPSEHSVSIHGPPATTKGMSKEELRRSSLAAVNAAADSPLTVPAEDATSNATFTNVSYEILPGKCGKGETKVILKGLTATAYTGEVLAIIGPSGSGKTTLLNAITLEPGPGMPSGQLAINGHALSAASYTKYCAYVPREDNLWATMTARAHLVLAFECYRPELSGSAREAKVDELLAATGMESCQHTRAGDMLRPGLSGGQRRRLSMALALVKEPKLVILDEPTSGLDSAAAAAITKLLGAIAKRTSSTILCTIHQPSAAVLAGFEKLFVLSEGRTAYFGPTSGLGAHLASLGHPVPPNCNPAEFALELVSRDVSSEADVKAVLDAWPATGGKGEVTSSTSTGTLSKPPATAGLMRQTVVLTKRAMRQAITDPIFYLVRMVMSALMISFFGLIYKESAQNINPQATFRLFFLWWVLAVPVSLNLVTVFVFNVELKTVKTEIKNGMYSPLAYVFANTLVQLPFMFGIAIFVLVPAFAIGGWSWSHFGTFFIAYSASMWAWECLAQLMSLFSNPVLGMLNFVSAWSAGILFCGLVFRGEDVIWPLRTFYYVLPMKWLFNSCAYDIFTPTTYSDAEICDWATDPACNGAGFKCLGNLTAIECFGRTGSQVLDTLHHSFDALSSKDERGIDLAAILAFAILLKVFYMVGVVMATKTTAKLQPMSGGKVQSA